MRTLDPAWLPLTGKLEDFHARLCAIHRAPDGSASYHQWQYALTPALAALVQGWHAAREVQHTRWVDQYYDTPERTLRDKHRAELRSRFCDSHSERRRLENSPEWSLRWQPRLGDPELSCVCWGNGVLPLLGYSLFRLPFLNRRRDGVPRSPLDYAPACAGCVTIDRYGPRFESNPRWWVEVAHMEHPDDEDKDFDDQTRRFLHVSSLVVECDPVARGYDSDDDEVVEHAPHVRTNNPEACKALGTAEHPFTPLSQCRVCTPVRLPPKKRDFVQDD